MDMENQKQKVYVVGHKNPDTDSVCSAIAYAYLKNQSDVRFNFVPSRAGQISLETQYVLDYFGVEQPVYLGNIGTRVKDMEIRNVPGVRRDISIKKAWRLMRKQNVFTLPITNKEGCLDGLITVNDIAKSYMEEHESAIVSVARTPYKNIMETLNGKMVVGDEDGCFEQGKVIIGAANPDVMERFIDKHDMVILANRYEAQLCAIEMGAGCIVVCLSEKVSKTIQYLAREHNCTVIITELDTYAVARLMNQCMPVEFFMKKKDIVSFHKNDYTEEIKEIMSQKRYRDFPVLDKNDKYVGMISRRNLLGVHKRSVILVDHNEASQAVDNVENAEVLEIIDHHRLGRPETMNPIYFRNQPVGCTATIIYQMYREFGIEIPREIAGLLCSAIISDTLLFRSPTCTMTDERAVKELAAIADIDYVTLAGNMFAAGSDFENLSAEEMLYQDFKKFEVGDQVLGIGQLTSMSEKELEKAKEKLGDFLEHTYASKEVDMIIFMLTNIMTESTEMICHGKGACELMENAFGVKATENAAVVPSIVSRKKQVVPMVMAAFNRMNEA